MKSNILSESGTMVDLLSRLTANYIGGQARTVFLVGSALVSPSVPSVAGMVQLVLEYISDNHSEYSELKADLTGTPEDYQKAFSFLHLRRGPDAVNGLLRRAVCKAYTEPLPELLDDRVCKTLENEFDSWKLTPAVEALGRIVAQTSEQFDSVILTTNFDPLIEIAIHRAGGTCYGTVLQDDGSIDQTVAKGCRVVHSHGYWYGSDTLHTPFQLEHPRPKLAASLRKLLRQDCLLAVVGFGGWRDVFTSTLAQLLREPENPDILWTFYQEDTGEISRRCETLLQMLQPGNRKRLTFYYGIDANALFPKLADRLESVPMTTVSIPKRSVADLRRDYLQQLQRECNRTRLIGLDSDSADPGKGRSISLDHVYVSLNTLSSEITKKGEPPKPPVSAVEAVWSARDGRAVLLGLPGSGKSTFLRVLALRLAKACAAPEFDLRETLPGWHGDPLLPVLVPLAYLAQELGERVGKRGWRVERFLERDIEDRLNLKGYAVHLLHELEEKGGMVLFDGLDEVTDSDLRVAVRDAIEGFAARYPRIRILVTCRTYSYSQEEWQLVGWPINYLAPLNQQQIDLFIDQWYEEQQFVDPSRSSFYEIKAKLLRKALSPGEGRRLHEIADNPLLLTVMAVVHTHRGELPDARASVYKECVDLLLLRWQVLRTPMAEPVNLVHALGVLIPALQRALQEVAYKAHAGRETEANKTTGLISRGLLMGTLHDHFQDSGKVETFLEYCEASNGLLLFQGITVRRDGDIQVKTYGFPHRTFQEYLAGLYLGRQPNLGSTIREHLDRGEEWREVIILLAEHLCFTENNAEQVEIIVDKLIPEKEEMRKRKPSLASWRAAWTAGDLLYMLRRTLTGKALDKSLNDQVVKLLVRLLGVASFPPKERAAAARTLAALGDPRPGSGNRRVRSGGELPDIQWASIPGGTLMMGGAKESWLTPATEKGAEETYESEYGPGQEPFPVKVRSFDLATYPVTLEQFRLFKKDDGYTNHSYWTATGWEWLQKRASLGVPFVLAYDSERESNHPVTPVTWHEAVAFCRWVTSRYREEGFLDSEEIIRLPTESEWEWAARGPEGRRWPWGNEWRSDACNSWEAQIGNFCAVGLFPAGVNWTGNVWDLSGNVLEWCSTKWVEKYEVDWQERSGRDEWTEEYLEGNDVRTLRGGYHVGEEIYTRVTRGACRFFYPPTVVDRNLGYSLRLLRAPEIRA